MSAPQVSSEAFAVAMQQKTQEYLQQVMASVNAAPDGDWIAASEERVRNLSADFRREVFEQALQMRADAAEAAFPPPHDPVNGKRLANAFSKRSRRGGSQLEGIQGRLLLQRRHAPAARRLHGKQP